MSQLPQIKLSNDSYKFSNQDDYLFKNDLLNLIAMNNVRNHNEDVQKEKNEMKVNYSVYYIVFI